MDHIICFWCLLDRYLNIQKRYHSIDFSSLPPDYRDIADRPPSLITPRCSRHSGVTQPTNGLDTQQSGDTNYKAIIEISFIQWWIIKLAAATARRSSHWKPSIISPWLGISGNFHIQLGDQQHHINYLSMIASPTTVFIFVQGIWLGLHQCREAFAPLPQQHPFPVPHTEK